MQLDRVDFRVCFNAAGVDFINISNSVILRSDVSSPIRITIVNDKTFERTETFMVNLSPCSGHGTLPPGVTLSQASTEVTIYDDDGESFIPVLHV